MLVLLVGVLLRVNVYLQQTPLTRDEMSLALNVGTRSPLELLRPLDYEQVAPPGFLQVEDLASRVAGLTPLALRFFPFLVGLLLPWLVWKVAQRVTDCRAALLATAMAALSPLMIRYANEVKPYGIDAVLAVLIVLLAIHVAESPDPSSRRRLLGASIVSLLLSVTAPFVIATCYFNLLVRRSLALKQTAVHGLILAMVFLLTYVFLLAPVGRGGYMNASWRTSQLSAAIPVSEKIELAAYASLNALTGPAFPRNFLQSPKAMLFLAILTGLLLIGVWSAGTSPRERPSWFWSGLLAGPLALALLASAVGVWPLAARTLLFAGPGVLVAVAAGLSSVSARFGSMQNAAFTVLAAVLLTPNLQAWRTLSEQEAEVSDIELFEMVRSRKTNEAIYVLGYSVVPWTFKTTDWSAPSVEQLRRVARLATAPESQPPRSTADEDTRWFCDSSPRVRLGLMPTRRARRAREPEVLDYAGSEARRIRDTATPRVWVLLTDLLPEVDAHLRAELSAAGGRVVEDLSGRRGSAVLYAFPLAATSPC